MREGVIYMQTIRVDGLKRLSGSVKIHGAKNSALPVLAAAFLANKQSVIHNCPNLSDVSASIQILRHLGSEILQEGTTLIIDSSRPKAYDIPEELMKEMRSSIVFLGAILAKTGKARLSMPGGCDIGLRPIDIHTTALEQMGVIIKSEHGYTNYDAPNGLKGAVIALSMPSVGATENIMLAATQAKGTTTIINAAREPEISDLADFLNGCGAKIHGAGEHTITIEGVKKIGGTDHTVISDRITATTFMCAAAITQGNVTVTDIVPAHLGPVIPYFEEAGCDVLIKSNALTVIAPPRLRPMKNIRTMPYPGFPTDAQALMMSLACVAEGTSVFVETIFENRYKHVPQLIRLGADIKVQDRVAVVEGAKKMYGAAVEATDLRGGAAMVVAALGAEGKSEISNIHHIDRGYEGLVENLSALGAKISKTEKSSASSEEIKLLEI